MTTNLTYSTVKLKTDRELKCRGTDIDTETERKRDGDREKERGKDWIIPIQ